MKWGEKRFNNLDYQLKKEFGEKVYKVSIDAGFSCPNRDGTISSKGCIFCSDKGSGEFAGDRCESIYSQIEKQISFLNKGKDKKYIAYFQNFTNTYADVIYLKKVYTEALGHKNIVGIAIATRADCLDEEVINLIDYFNKRTFLWLEIGLQTIHNRTAEIINRGYKIDLFERKMATLADIKIKVVIHLIFGLPFETYEDIKLSIKKMNDYNIWGIKIHLLYIIKNTELYKYYMNRQFKIFKKDEYISMVVDMLEILDKDIVIHRLTGDGMKETLFEPKWSLNKRAVLNGINSLLKKRNTWQGKLLGEV